MENGRRRADRQRFGQVLARVFAGHARIQSFAPVMEPGVVSGDQVAQHPAGTSQAFLGEQRTGRRMGRAAWLGLDVGGLGVHTGGGADVGLEARAVLA